MFFNRKKSTPKNSSDDIGPRAGPGPGRQNSGIGPAFSKYDWEHTYFIFVAGYCNNLQYQITSNKKENVTEYDPIGNMTVYPVQSSLTHRKS